MRKAGAHWSAVMAGCLWFSAVAFAQLPPLTKTISIDVFLNPPNGCGYMSGQQNFPFMDTVGGDWSKLEVRMSLAYRQDQPPPTLSIAINGDPIDEPVQITNPGGFCENRQPYVFESGKLPNYIAFGQNRLNVFSIGGFTGGDTAVVLTFTVPVPTFEFELVPASTAARMLIRNDSPQGTLPPYQIVPGPSGRPRFRFPGVVKVDNAGAARDVWFRVVDPKDTAPYGTPSENDNHDPSPKGFLTTAGCGDPSCRVSGGTPLRIRSDASGRVEPVLEGTNRYSGDNYLLEASFDAQFTCATAGPNGTNLCPRSGLVTAWKRINVEVHKMFVAGAFLTDPVSPGDILINVSDVSAFPNPPFVVRLIHGASADGGSPQDFYHEEVTVRHIQGRRLLNFSPAPGRLYLREPNNPSVGDTVQASYSGLENILGIDRPYLADAVGLGATSADYTTVDTSLVAPLFDDAFVEFLWLSDEGSFNWPDPRYGRVIPFVHELQRGDGAMTELLARKWMRNAQRVGVWRVAEPNHQMVFLANRKYGLPGEIHRGDTRVSHAFNDLWLYTAATPNSDLRAEALTHELGHEWLVNQFYLNGQPTTINDYPGGHCDRAFGMPQHIGTAANASHLCEMTSGNNMWTSSEARDRRVGFHHVVLPGQPIDSEYLHIRHRAEPVPQNDNPRTRMITQ